MNNTTFDQLVSSVNADIKRRNNENAQAVQAVHDPPLSACFAGRFNNRCGRSRGQNIRSRERLDFKAKHFNVMKRKTLAAHHGVSFENVCHYRNMPGHFIIYCCTRIGNEDDRTASNAPQNRKNY